MKKLIILFLISFCFANQSNYERILQNSKKLCEQNEAKACFNLATIYYNGLAGNIEYKNALKYYDKACKLKDNLSCKISAAMYLSELGNKKDVNSAIYNFNQACLNEDVSSCQVLANFYIKGEIVSKNDEKAKAYLIKACDFGEQKACDEVKKFKQN